MNMEMSAADWGTSSTMTMVATIGNKSFSSCGTLRDFFIRIFRSFSVVKARMIGG